MGSSKRHLLQHLGRCKVCILYDSYRTKERTGCVPRSVRYGLADGLGQYQDLLRDRVERNQQLLFKHSFCYPKCGNDCVHCSFELFTTVLTSIQTTFSTIWTAISTAVSSVLNTIHTTVTTVWTAISTAISTVMNTISTTITSVWNGIYNTIKPLLDAFKYLFETIWQAIQILIGAKTDRNSDEDLFHLECHRCFRDSDADWIADDFLYSLVSNSDCYLHGADCDPDCSDDGVERHCVVPVSAADWHPDPDEYGMECDQNGHLDCPFCDPVHGFFHLECH